MSCEKKYEADLPMAEDYVCRKTGEENLLTVQQLP